MSDENLIEVSPGVWLTPIRIGESIKELEAAIGTIGLTDGGINAIKHIRIAIGILTRQGKE